MGKHTMKNSSVTAWRLEYVRYHVYHHAHRMTIDAAKCTWSVKQGLVKHQSLLTLTGNTHLIRECQRMIIQDQGIQGDEGRLEQLNQRLSRIRHRQENEGSHLSRNTSYLRRLENRASTKLTELTSGRPLCAEWPGEPRFRDLHRS